MEGIWPYGVHKKFELYCQFDTHEPIKINEIEWDNKITIELSKDCKEIIFKDNDKQFKLFLKSKIV